jgi:hypothetical protein
MIIAEGSVRKGSGGLRVLRSGWDLMTVQAGSPATYTIVYNDSGLSYVYLDVGFGHRELVSATDPVLRPVAPVVLP